MYLDIPVRLSEPWEVTLTRLVYIGTSRRSRTPPLTPVSFSFSYEGSFGRLVVIALCFLAVSAGERSRFAVGMSDPRSHCVSDEWSGDTATSFGFEADKRHRYRSTWTALFGMGVGFVGFEGDADVRYRIFFWFGVAGVAT